MKLDPTPFSRWRSEEVKETAFRLDELLADVHGLRPGLGLIRLMLSKPSQGAERARALIQNAGGERDWILDDHVLRFLAQPKRL